ILFNWVFGTIALMAAFQIALDLAMLVAMVGGVAGSDIWIEARYAVGIAAFALAAFGVRQAIRVPRLRDVTVVIPNLPKAFEGYRLVQLTDLHISRLFPAIWTRAVVDATN